MRAHVYTEGEADPSFLTYCVPEAPSGSVVLSRGMSGSSFSVKMTGVTAGSNCGQCRRHFFEKQCRSHCGQFKKMDDQNQYIRTEISPSVFHALFFLNLTLSTMQL